MPGYRVLRRLGTFSSRQRRRPCSSPGVCRATPSPFRTRHCHIKSTATSRRVAEDNPSTRLHHHRWSSIASWKYVKACEGRGGEHKARLTWGPWRRDRAAASQEANKRGWEGPQRPQGRSSTTPWRWGGSGARRRTTYDTRAACSACMGRGQGGTGVGARLCCMRSHPRHHGVPALRRQPTDPCGRKRPIDGGGPNLARDGAPLSGAVGSMVMNDVTTTSIRKAMKRMP